MDEAWQILRAAGVPLGPIRPAPVCLPSADELRSALHAARRRLDLLDEPARTALLAWLSAWQHHWPTSFSEALGEDGAVLLTELRAKLQDPNRYLKLRRIATENLSGVL